jgi:hypothetical protein
MSEIDSMRLRGCIRRQAFQRPRRDGRGQAADPTMGKGKPRQLRTDTAGTRVAAARLGTTAAEPDGSAESPKPQQDRVGGGLWDGVGQNHVFAGLDQREGGAGSGSVEQGLG